MANRKALNIYNHSSMILQMLWHLPEKLDSIQGHLLKKYLYLLICVTYKYDYIIQYDYVQWFMCEQNSTTIKIPLFPLKFEVSILLSYAWPPLSKSNSYSFKICSLHSKSDFFLFEIWIWIWYIFSTHVSAIMIYWQGISIIWHCWCWKGGHLSIGILFL